MVRLIRLKCDENMLRCNWKKCSSVFNYIKVNFSGLGEAAEDILMRESGRFGALLVGCQRRRLGRKLLVLGFCGQGAVGLGVVDHLGEQALAERRQGALP